MRTEYFWPKKRTPIFLKEQFGVGIEWFNLIENGTVTESLVAYFRVSFNSAKSANSKYRAWSCHCLQILPTKCSLKGRNAVHKEVT